ncbi:hypothetical protein HF521_007307 [Silurus meridionalis]|uniref:UDP-glucuronosyltransferase n=1 Tax=Silurus meridionalis TaxID=175797 RepID=A0A8T0AR44_SILME|nr:hypothetical protein HF521_007307 [Silurus meridionalis]
MPFPAHALRSRACAVSVRQDGRERSAKMKLNIHLTARLFLAIQQEQHQDQLLSRFCSSPQKLQAHDAMLVLCDKENKLKLPHRPVESMIMSAHAEQMVTESHFLEKPNVMAEFLQRNIDIQRDKGSLLSLVAVQQEMFNLMKEGHRTSAEMVRLILEDKTLVKKLRDTKYDLILTDPGYGEGHLETPWPKTIHCGQQHASFTQNDLLGHPKTKVFITHGGTNSIYEAIYHGVPVLGIPLIFDQFENILKIKARGVAEALSVTALDVDTLTLSLKNILDDKQPYRKNMHRMSEILRETPIKPMDTTSP